MTAACEHAEAEHKATQRLTRATWALVLVTAVLVIVTALLAQATWQETAGQHEAPVATERVATQ